MTNKPSHPYRELPETSYWKQSVAARTFEDMDPVLRAPFQIAPSDKVATAGSCFAQHISRHIQKAGYNYFVTEDAHPLVVDPLTAPYIEEAQYGVYTARYGNVYTARQLLQLMRRAYGKFEPSDSVWTLENGRYVDPFRPRIQKEGFATVEELQASRAHHFACVRRAFEELDVFVFTLGLTECWESRADGAVFPVCPGVAGGAFDPALYDFRNLTVSEVVADMKDFITELRALNPHSKLILTVSPVPLVATAEPRHVLVSTVASKSILRAACDELERGTENLAYFPSYEIATFGYKNRSGFFAGDCRTVTEQGVAHIMGLFLRHFTTGDRPLAAPRPAKPADTFDIGKIEDAVNLVCEEELLAMGK